MIKKYSKPINIIVILGCLIHLTISQVYGGEYARYFMYLLIIIVIPMMILDVIKQRKEDKLMGTAMFKSSIYRMLIMTVLLIVVFFITKQNQI